MSDHFALRPAPIDKMREGDVGIKRRIVVNIMDARQSEWYGVVEPHFFDQRVIFFKRHSARTNVECDADDSDLLSFLIVHDGCQHVE